MVNIRRPLPELERASLQLQSPMPSHPASPTPFNPDTPPSIQESIIAWIPHSTILKGSQFAPTANFRLQTSRPPTLPPAPSNGAPAFTGMSNSSFDKHLSIQASQHPQIDAPACTGMPQSWASEHPGIQASMPQVQRSAAEAVAYK